MTVSVASRTSPSTRTSQSTDSIDSSSRTTAETLWKAPTTVLSGSAAAASSHALPSGTRIG
jgi:hypothetical protein